MSWNLDLDGCLKRQAEPSSWGNHFDDVEHLFVTRSSATIQLIDPDRIVHYPAFQSDIIDIASLGLESKRMFKRAMSSTTKLNPRNFPRLATIVPYPPIREWNQTS